MNPVLLDALIYTGSGLLIIAGLTMIAGELLDMLKEWIG